MSQQVTRLGKEVILYALAPPASDEHGKATSKAGGGSYAAVLPLTGASTPLATLRAPVALPSSSSWTTATSYDAENTLVIHAERERPLIHAHVHSSRQASGLTCSPIARLYPPEATPALSVSSCGTLLAAGGKSGHIYVWHLPSGRQLVSLDAHYRTVTCLQWTSCGQALVSASEDARVLVWSLEALVSQDRHSSDLSLSSSTIIRPFAILADHVQAVTSFVLSSSSRSAIAAFPSSLRVLSASADGTVKLWDVRTRNLIATWTFPGPVQNLKADVGFRSFLANVQQRIRSDGVGMGETVPSYHAVHKIELYGPRAVHLNQPGSNGMAAAIARIRDDVDACYKSKQDVRITAMELSLNGSHLFLGLSDANMITVDLASGVVIRTVSLLPSGQTGFAKIGSGAGQHVQIDVSTIMTYTMQDNAALLQGATTFMGKGSGAGLAQRDGVSQWPIAEKLDRALPSSDDQRPVPVRLADRNVKQLVAQLTPPSRKRRNLTEEATAAADLNEQGGSGKRDKHAAQQQTRIAQLERENEKLQNLLKRSQKSNADLWDQIVTNGSASASAPLTSTATE